MTGEAIKQMIQLFIENYEEHGIDLKASDYKGNTAVDLLIDIVDTRHGSLEDLQLEESIEMLREEFSKM